MEPIFTQVVERMLAGSDLESVVIVRDKALLAEIRKEYLGDLKKLNKLLANKDAVQANFRLFGQLQKKYERFFYDVILQEQMATLSRGSKDEPPASKVFRGKAWSFVIAFGDIGELERAWDAEDFGTRKKKYLDRLKRTGREAIKAAEDYIAYALKEPDLDLATKATIGQWSVVPKHGVTSEVFGKALEAIKAAEAIIRRSAFNHLLANMVIYVDAKSENLHAGSYGPESDTIKLHPLGGNVETMIHELGHRWWFKFMSPSGRSFWQRAYDGDLITITEEDVDEWVDLRLQANRMRDPADAWRDVWKAVEAEWMKPRADDPVAPYKLQYLAEHETTWAAEKPTFYREYLMKALVGRRIMRNPVSDYGNTNAKEGFAEIFKLTLLGKEREASPITRYWFRKAIGM